MYFSFPDVEDWIPTVFIENILLSRYKLTYVPSRQTSPATSACLPIALRHYRYHNQQLLQGFFLERPPEPLLLSLSSDYGYNTDCLHHIFQSLERSHRKYPAPLLWPQCWTVRTGRLCQQDPTVWTSIWFEDSGFGELLGYFPQPIKWDACLFSYLFDWSVFIFWVLNKIHYHLDGVFRWFS